MRKNYDELWENLNEKIKELEKKIENNREHAIKNDDNFGRHKHCKKCGEPITNSYKYISIPTDWGLSVCMKCIQEEGVKKIKKDWEQEDFGKENNGKEKR